ncbi:stress response translation initiation inhibitor YciH [Candidatus Woesearchaeota archaeon]|nr:stress response translation initiation inhibitor YciH [Candidatus Woesearchaeota archaeon]
MTACPRCGLPKDLCVCESIAKESQKIIVKIEKKKYGKKYTMISGIDPKEIDLDKLAKQLKAKFACGGTVKSNVIELQGGGGQSKAAEERHLQEVKQILIENGFAPETIQIE